MNSDAGEEYGYACKLVDRDATRQTKLLVYACGPFY